MRLALFCLCWIATGVGDALAGGWRSVAPGMELGTFTTREASGSAQVTVLRIDPESWDLALAGTSLASANLAGESVGRTAKQWCQSQGFTAAINAGMFATDYKTHVGYLKFREHVNSSRVNGYQSVAAFDPRASKLARFRIFDLDAPRVTMDSILRDYASAVQNLRLIKRPGSNQWGQQAKQWSEAALGEDKSGHILFIFCRSPFSMHDLNHELLAMGMGLTCAQHLEGGPEAQLYLRAGDSELELFGSHEASLTEDDGNSASWPVPNVLGVRPRAASPPH